MAKLKKIAALASIILLITSFIGCDMIESATDLDSSAPSGTYVCTVLGMEQTATFKGNTLEMYDKLGGKRVFKYKISEDGSRITVTNVVTGKTTTESFKFIKEHQIIVMSGLEYHRR